MEVKLKKALETLKMKTHTSKLINEHLKIYDLSMLDSDVMPSICSVAARITPIYGLHSEADQQTFLEKWQIDSIS